MKICRGCLRAPVGFLVEADDCVQKEWTWETYSLPQSRSRTSNSVTRRRWAAKANTPPLLAAQEQMILTIQRHELGRYGAHGVEEGDVREVAVVGREGEVHEEALLVDEVLAQEFLAEEDLAEVVDELWGGQRDGPVWPDEGEEVRPTPVPLVAPRRLVVVPRTLTAAATLPSAGRRVIARSRDDGYLFHGRLKANRRYSGTGRV